jgi:hypothetical protein
MEMAMAAVKDLSGQKFSNLLVLAQDVAGHKKGRTRWLVRCDCGTVKSVMGQALKDGTTISCGCQHRAKLAERMRKHGGAKTRLHNIWIGMRQRCRNPKDNGYKDYGGRGIRFSPAWEEFADFKRWAEANQYDDTLEIERIDNNSDYSPDNCRWATRGEQCQNTRRNVFHEFQGKKLTLSEIARATGHKRGSLQNRLNNGMSIAQAVSTRLRYHRNLITYNGEEMTVYAAALRAGKNPASVRNRIRRGQSLERAIECASSL